MKEIAARITLRWPDPEWERLRYRRLRYGRMMLNAGIRPASIKRYLQKGFPSGWIRAVHRELERMRWDIKYWGRKRI